MRVPMSLLKLANAVKDERDLQSCGYDAATPDWLQFSAKHQTPEVRKYGPAVLRLQQQSHPKRAIWWLRLRKRV